MRNYKLKLKVLGFLVGATALLTGCVTNELSENAVQLKKIEVEKLLSGKTASGDFRWSKGTWSEYYNADGRVAFKSSVMPSLFGSWRVNGNSEICTKYFGYENDKEFCSPVYQDGTQTVTLISDGRKKGKINAYIRRLEDGDTESLMN